MMLAVGVSFVGEAVDIVANGQVGIDLKCLGEMASGFLVLAKL